MHTLTYTTALLIFGGFPGFSPRSPFLGPMDLPNYEFFTQIDDRHCSLCDQVHPFDALSCLAQCRHLSYARSIAFDVWPPPTQHVVTDWYKHASRDDKRKSIRTLLPKSLSSRLESIVGLPLRESLAHRKPKLAKCPSSPPATRSLFIGQKVLSTSG